MKPPTAEDSATPVKPEMSASSTGSGTPTTVASTSTQTQAQPQQTPGGGTGSNASNALGTVKYRIKPPSAAHATSSSTATGPPNAGCFIKPSLSLNSLPPQGPHEGSEMAQNRLRIDRPYNSLKKKRDSERELWRRSWGSGHSHSSCSLQSSITTGIGKDDFWAALQTNYNFIMDTNLLDSCREARGEIEGSVVRPREDHMDYYRRAMFKPSPMQTFYGDPRLLRQWIREMEIRISRIPSITETKRLNTEQLLRLSGEHSNYGPNALNVMVLFLVLIVEMVVYCVNGTRLSENALKVSDAIYNYKWYQEPAAMQRDLRFMIQRAQKPCGVTAAKFYFVNIERLGIVVQASYSYYLILKNRF